METAFLPVTEFIVRQVEPKGVYVGVFLDVEEALNPNSIWAIRKGAKEHVKHTRVEHETLGNRILASTWMVHSVGGTASEG